MFDPGKDLDAVLKATPILPEKEARIIIVQVFQGLVYLNKKAQKIIHYDLKPGNVLFDEVGVTKVTNVGLNNKYFLLYLVQECMLFLLYLVYNYLTFKRNYCLLHGVISCVTIYAFPCNNIFISPV